MSIETQAASTIVRIPAGRFVFAWPVVAVLAALLDIASVMVAAVLSSAVYYAAAFGEPFWHVGDINFELTIGIFLRTCPGTTGRIRVRAVHVFSQF